MPLDLWLAFVAATTLLVITPGPTVTLVVSYALGEGRRAAFAAAAGVALGGGRGRSRSRWAGSARCWRLRV